MIENKMVVNSQWNYLENDVLFENAVSQPECAGIDFYGFEILEGDEIVIDQANFQEIILKENLKRYLEERCDFAFFNLYGMGVVLDKYSFKVVAEQDLEKFLHEDHGFQFTQAE